MPLAPGARVGSYEVIAPIGRGGMGEVYRARDPKLHREVAIKALPREFEQDRERLARFEREARLLAALNHPNIAAIYGLEEQGGARYLVLELIDGETLAERLGAGPLPVDEALAVAVQIASGLEAAHAAGIIHRDLKPSNVKIRPGGAVKVLDLGLARTVESNGAVDSSLSPTLTTPATHAGVVLGTAAYMSPEQARGKPLDKRTDIFSFGCVLYECLTGKQAFGGETVSDSLSAILRAEPDWSALPEPTPARARDVLRRCLQKDPRRRLHDIADARIELEEAQSEGPPKRETAPAAPAPGSRLVWGIGGAILGAAVVAAAWVLSRPPLRPAPTGMHAVVPLSRGDRLWAERPSLAMSPDGKTVVFAAVREGVVRLFRRRLDGASPEPIQGTEEGSRPFFSADGQWVGFIAGSELRKVPLSGGTATTLTLLPPRTQGASWGTDDRIVMTVGFNTGLYTVSDSGGPLRPLTTPDIPAGEHAHLYPQVLPGGRAVLFTVRLGRDFADVEKSNIDVLEIPTGKRRTVLESATYARYGGGRLVFLRGTSVFSCPFDLSRLEVAGPPVPLSENIAIDLDEGAAHFTLSSDGTLAFVDGPAIRMPPSVVLRLDRAGRETALPLPAAPYMSPRLSPDGKRLAVIRWAGLRRSIVVYDRERGIASIVTPEPGSFLCPTWSPDGKRLAFSRIETTRPWLSVKNTDGTGQIEGLTPPPNDAEFPTSWSPDGATLAFTALYRADRSPSRRLLTGDIWLFTLAGANRGAARPWFETPFRESAATFSPDGRWIAYVSDEDGSPEIYVRPFPGPGAPTKISTEPGIEPAWSRGGREILFRAGSRAERFMSVEVQTSPVLKSSTPRLLFSSDLETGPPGRTDQYREYDVSRDGSEVFATRTVKTEEPQRQLGIVTGWTQKPE